MCPSTMLGHNKPRGNILSDRDVLLVLISPRKHEPSYFEIIENRLILIVNIKLISKTKCNVTDPEG